MGAPATPVCVCFASSAFACGAHVPDVSTPILYCPMVLSMPELVSRRRDSQSENIQVHSLLNLPSYPWPTHVHMCVQVDVERAELDVLQGIRPEHWALIRQVR